MLHNLDMHYKSATFAITFFLIVFYCCTNNKDSENTINPVVNSLADKKVMDTLDLTKDGFFISIDRKLKHFEDVKELRIYISELFSQNSNPILVVVLDLKTEYKKIDDALDVLLIIARFKIKIVTSTGNSFDLQYEFSPRSTKAEEITQNTPNALIIQLARGQIYTSLNNQVKIHRTLYGFESFLMQNKKVIDSNNILFIQSKDTRYPEFGLVNHVLRKNGYPSFDVQQLGR
jgi:biopolymer transport protein ExbD